MKAFKDPVVREKAKLQREKRKTLINCRLLKRRRRKPGEIPDPRTAIQNHCRECMGFTADDMPSLKACVEACTAYECWLHPWRVGVLDGNDCNR